MREFKFRVWDKEIGVFVNPFYHAIKCNFVGENLNILRSEYMFDSFREVGNSDRYIIQQFTGLKDKNGVEIYEGDIVYLDYPYGDEERLKQNLFTIEFDRGSFIISPKKLFEGGVGNFSMEKYCVGLDGHGDEVWDFRWPLSRSIYSYNICVVVGNIFENSDLIK